jgi:hypothetical protein
MAICRIEISVMVGLTGDFESLEGHPLSLEDDDMVSHQRRETHLTGVGRSKFLGTSPACSCSPMHGPHAANSLGSFMSPDLSHKTGD